MSLPDFPICSYLLTVLLYCCYTPAHEILYQEVFLPSVPAGFEVRASVIGIEGRGDYLSDEFLQCIRAKLDLVVTSIEENLGQEIVWSDVDIRFFDVTPDGLGVQLLSADCDILFQRESPRMLDVNTGFFVCHCTQPVLDFFRTIRTELDLYPEENEQMVVNRLILPLASHSQRLRHVVQWGYLPAGFYARTHGWPPPRHLALYHANYTKGRDAIRQKRAQFSEIACVRHWGLPAWLWSVIRRIPGRISAP
ncbi:MAG: putative nucleotide-diphospho-sugar transferase [Terrimicrobiaceae bacterium]